MGYFSSNLTRHKLFMLYFLKSSGFELKQDQLLRLMMNNEWMDYFSFKQSLSDLLENGMLRKDPQSDTVLLSVYGRKALSEFEERLPLSSREEVDRFAKNNRRSVQLGAEHISSYERISDSEYIAELKIVEKDRDLISIKINLVSREAALSVCTRWEKKAQDLYVMLLDGLTGNDQA